MAFTDENCPYCGVYLSSSSLIPQQEDSSSHQAPYKNVTDKSVPASPYELKNQTNNAVQEEEETVDRLQEEADFSQRNYLMSFLLLLTGSVFCFWTHFVSFLEGRSSDAPMECLLLVSLSWSCYFLFSWVGALFGLKKTIRNL
ncbi:MAG: hypothetical protein HWD61_08775 [Parachlamydiaceae bacterium]|nr:MAG: hypothetical protein HWD61_08775 [Parachlamydiaceae bacterium]